MSFFEKHINETDDFAFDFSNVLATGESLSNPEVKVTLRDTDDDDQTIYVDKTSEFGDLGTAVDGERVEFTLNAQTQDGEQEDYTYVVYCEVDTSEGRTLVSTQTLKTTDVAKVSDG